MDIYLYSEIETPAWRLYSQIAIETHWIGH